MIDERHQDIIAAYYERPATLNDVGRRFGISGERVRQILTRNGHDERHSRADLAELHHVQLTCANVECGKTFSLPPVTAQTRIANGGWCSPACRTELKRLSTPARRRMARAYDMRSRENMLWRDIAEELGYSNAVSAINIVRRFAMRHELPWPLPREDV